MKRFQISPLSHHKYAMDQNSFLQTNFLVSQCYYFPSLSLLTHHEKSRINLTRVSSAIKVSQTETGYHVKIQCN